MRLLHLSAIALSLAVSTGAQATEFHLTYTTYVDATSGPAMTVDALITADPSGYADHGFFVTGISGTRGSATLSFYDNFDEIYYPANSAGDYLDSFGLSFYAGATLYQIYKDGAGDFAYHEYDGSTGRLVFPSALSLTEVTASVPEPTIWALMIGGFGMVGAALRRRRHALATQIARA